MLLAHRAGIQVFGTGGLGGVHRGGQDTMDISADLTELGRTPVAVISSGCKSFLDIPRTLEYLETHGATVCTFADGRSGPINFPAFYTRDSGTKSPMVVRDAREAAAIICRLPLYPELKTKITDNSSCSRSLRFAQQVGSAFCQSYPREVRITQSRN
jgi:pseudouridine-5'-phosphate glycosidase/pseudouridine kinase